MNKTLLLIFLIIFTISCSISKSKSTQHLVFPSVEEAAKSRLSEEVEYIPNNDKTFMLCTSTVTKSNVTTIKFVVIDMSDNSIVKTPSGIFRSVSWASPIEIKVDYSPGVPISGVDKYSYIYDVVSQKKVNPKTNKNP